MKFSRELEVPAIPTAADEANTTHVRRTKAKAKQRAPRQIPTKNETSKSWRGPRQDPQMAKSS